MQRLGIKLVGGALVIGGIVYPIPSLTRGEVSIPLIGESQVVEELPQATIVTTGSSLHASVEGIAPLANSHVAAGLLVLVLGAVILLLSNQRSPQLPSRRYLNNSLAFAMIILGVVPTVIMRLIDTAAMDYLGITQALGARPETQLALIITAIGILGFMPLRESVNAPSQDSVGSATANARM